MNIRKYFTQHKSQIYIGLGLACYVGSIYEVIKATIKATRKIDQKKAEIANEAIVPVDPSGIKLPIKQVIKEVGPLYLSSLALVGASTGLVLKGFYTSETDKLEWMTACVLTKNASDLYQEATKEIVGENKEKKIREAAAEKSADVVPMPVNPECTGDGNTLYYIPYCMYYFRSSPDAVNKGIVTFLKRLNRINDTESIGDLFGELGIFPERYSNHDIGSELGWKPEDDLDIYVKWRENGPEPCGLIMFSANPHENYDKYD